MWKNLQTFLLVIQVYFNVEGNDSCPTGFIQHSYYFNKCYHVSQGAIKDTDYESHCSDMGGTRACIHNNAIDQFVNVNITSDDYFIGLSWTTDPPLVFSWIDGTTAEQWTKVIDYTPKKSDNAYYNPLTDKWEFSVGTPHFALCEYLIGYQGDSHVALVGGTETCGRIEIFHNGIWGTISDPSPEESLGRFVCSHLGYSFVSYDSSCSTDIGTGKIWLEAVICPSNATTINDCVLDPSDWGPSITNHASDVHVRCEDDVTISTPGESTSTGSLITTDDVTISTKEESISTENAITTEHITILTESASTENVITREPSSVYSSVESVSTASLSTIDPFSTNNVISSEHITTYTESTYNAITTEYSSIQPSLQSISTEYSSIHQSLESASTGPFSIYSSVDSVSTQYSSIYPSTEYVSTMDITSTEHLSIYSLAESSLNVIVTDFSSIHSSMESVLTVNTSTSDIITLHPLYLSTDYCTSNCTATVTVTITHSVTAVTSSTLFNASSSSSSLLLNISTPVNKTTTQIEVIKYNKKSSAMYSTATVYDMRPSSVAIGTVGVVILCFIVGFIIGSDCYHVVIALYYLQKNIRILFQKRCKRFTDMRKNKTLHDLTDYTVYVEECGKSYNNTSPKGGQSLKLENATSET